MKERIKKVAETRAHYGYRRIHVLLRPEGWHTKDELNHAINPHAVRKMIARV